MTDARDRGLTLNPKYDDHGLITAVVTDVASGDVLMVAHMNAQALDLTVQTGLAHFWSRSRQALWKKGETSGHMLEVRDIRIDCDQDAVWVKAVPAGPTCHTGARSCFFRRVGADGLSAVSRMRPLRLLPLLMLAGCQQGPAASGPGPMRRLRRCRDLSGRQSKAGS